MPRITTDFRISGPVDFLDVNVERDNLLFIDPSAIRVAAKTGDRYGLVADAALTKFFDEILVKLRSAAPADHISGERSLQHFRELGATRLGMSSEGTQGHGAAEKLGTQIWNELLGNPLCQLAVATLKYVEDIPLFVARIDKDVTSDVTARIVLETLEQFTSDMMAKHPEFHTRRPTTTMKTTYWNNARATWESKTLTLPVADGKPLLLVPKWFANYKIQMTYGQYYGVAVLDYVKWENLVKVVRRKETVSRPRFTKKELKTMSAFAPNRSTSANQTARILEKDGIDVLGSYRAERQSSFLALTDDQLEFHLSRRPGPRSKHTGGRSAREEAEQ
ncbi:MULTISPECIES: hypothetical protein [Cryobacterium]|uniref:Uncharacterized protein n=1 Tax=Cryobacterium breve TaxID=1259258 RepID=A0ABY2IU29_9MICO|nr:MULTISPECIES: hypothetical protein [Cryobacterium]TFC94022.1 hypothetical protein E3T20_09215 [Cryobacterium sp. TmT3-12]TFC94692.1 hypothetical protein E3O65_16515 [Cryobacterium breve]